MKNLLILAFCLCGALATPIIENETSPDEMTAELTSPNEMATELDFAEEITGEAEDKTEDVSKQPCEEKCPTDKCKIKCLKIKCDYICRVARDKIANQGACMC